MCINDYTCPLKLGEGTGDLVFHWLGPALLVYRLLSDAFTMNRITWLNTLYMQMCISAVSRFIVKNARIHNVYVIVQGVPGKAEIN